MWKIFIDALLVLILKTMITMTVINVMMSWKFLKPLLVMHLKNFNVCSENDSSTCGYYVSGEVTFLPLDIFHVGGRC